MMMRAVDIIVKKREGQVLLPEEIDYLVGGYAGGEIPDYQMAAFCMAVCFQGMNDEETSRFTMSMVASGKTVDLSPIPGFKVDKHSTGGVADTTTLVLAPLVAAAGVPVAKMAGRGLGHTGGTIDKLESIPGFCTSLSKEEFFAQVNRINLAITGQSEDLVPVDQKLYALRDVTGTVESIPLIASSIMSKKIAAGAQAIVLDVKTGSGAFMKKKEEAFRLARAMVAIGKGLGRKTLAVVSDMNEPLGSAIGNALEVEEAIRVLRGELRGRLRQHCFILGRLLLLAAGRVKGEEEAEKLMDRLLDSGAALEKMAEMIRAQGGNAAVTEDTSILPQARYRRVIEAPQEGYLEIKDAQGLGKAAMLLGAGRETKGAKIDLSVGLRLHARTGDKIEKGQPLLTIFYNNDRRLPEAAELAAKCLSLSHHVVPANPLVYGMIE
ncbi:MAG: pyrimidine-nucleoside phosphorylase [Peptococcaceae bacterium]|nr:pyrimidine-nucleoside phosphorylase [Peptococcaceae bacterium]MDH7525313.1 pyrimidine-nucleoside phosphorylase [Peptococcaceae bacterium]